MSIRLKRYDGQTISPTDDAILYDTMIRHNGIVKGCAMTHLGSNQILMEAGRGVIKGRDFAVEEETIMATLSSSGEQPGRLIAHMDLMDTVTPLKFITQVGTNGELQALIQNENCNYTSGIYEVELATYTVSEIAISDFKVTAKDLQSWIKDYDMMVKGMVVETAVPDEDGNYTETYEDGSTKKTVIQDDGSILMTFTDAAKKETKMITTIKDDGSIETRRV